MTLAAQSLTDRLGEATPYIEISNEIDRAVSTLRVVWLALMNREWLDDEHVEHCAECLDRATKDLTEVRTLATNKAEEIYGSALLTKCTADPS